MQQIDGLVHEHIASGTFPGAEILLTKGQEILHHKAYGTFDGRRNDAVPLNSVWDLASITKPMVTANLSVILHHQNVVDLFAPVSTYLPSEYKITNWPITLADLALHIAGLPATSPEMRNADTANDARGVIMRTTPIEAQIGQIEYSCVGYIILGTILRHATGKSLNQLFKEHVSGPLGLNRTIFNPLQNGISPTEIAPTSSNENPKGYLRGVVNDTTARSFNRVAGNAGLFSTAHELHKIATHLLKEKDPLLFGTDARLPQINRTIGFEKYAPLTDKIDAKAHWSIGHTGHTGTAIYICPHSEIILVALTNRSYISARDNLNQIKDFRDKLRSICTLTHA